MLMYSAMKKNKHSQSVSKTSIMYLSKTSTDSCITKQNINIGSIFVCTVDND